MLIGDYNGNGQTVIRGIQARDLRVSYTPNSADKLNTALQFVINKIGFIPKQKITISQEPVSYVTLIDAGGNVLTISLNAIENGTGTENIIFHTDDCLRDYHKYLMAGVEFVSRPGYHAAGLQVDFIDNEDNRYTLLEERIYTEP